MLSSFLFKYLKQPWFYGVVGFLWQKCNFLQSSSSRAKWVYPWMCSCYALTVMCMEVNAGWFVIGEFCFVFLRKECFHLYCCCLDSRCVSCSVTDCVLACLFVCLWVVMHVAMQFPCLSTMCFCLWEWWIEGRQLMWFRCSTRSVCSAARACVRALSTCVQPNLQCTCVFVCLPPSSPLFHSSSCTPPTRYHFFLMLCSFWTRSK